MPLASLHEDLPLEVEPLRDPRPLAGRLRGLAHRNGAAIALALAILGLTAPVLSASYLVGTDLLPDSAAMSTCASESLFRDSRVTQANAVPLQAADIANPVCDNDLAG
ncbi:hypothetical protein L0V05_08225 [Tabrizicola sp. J26]|uniref:hypothetical protein n=1 Tax=Alitabrizicola rongguiensis TaxID=2909234 RepID=UPI001F243AED|nr:hypothetical protein [Tabrizicola rongguiensis]MCF1708798.1 hypothetical protein [Tabrizicola rongguiensis]